MDDKQEKQQDISIESQNDQPKTDSPPKITDSLNDVNQEADKNQSTDQSGILTQQQEKKPEDSSNENAQKQTDSNSIDAVIGKSEETQVQVHADPKAPKLFFYGSCECDQFYIGEDRFDSKRPIEVSNFFSNINAKVYSVACGALHTVILLTNGDVYTVGCNDDGALGRTGEENRPEKVDLPVPIDMISAGDSHSIACNSANAVFFHWGVYRNVLTGKLSQVETPHKIGEKEFARKKIKKVLSGANHTLVLADEKVYIWGDPEGGALGRMPTERRRTVQGLTIEGLGVRGVQDIFTGAYHSFLVRKTTTKEDSPTAVLAWGLNNFGQLGIGTIDNTATPTEITSFEGKKIKNITGGEHHTIALTEDGEVYGFGKNDEGQLGLGEDYQPQSESDNDDEEDNEPEKMDEETKDAVNKDDKMVDEKDEKKETTKTKESKKSKKVAEEIKSTKDRVIKPVLLKVSDIVQIYSGSNYNYAIDKNQDVYSWGMGENYNLGTREDETVYNPEKIKEPFFKAKPFVFGLGAQHVAYLSITDEGEIPKLDEQVLAKQSVKKPEKKTPTKSAAPQEEKKEPTRGRAKEKTVKKTPEKTKSKKEESEDEESGDEEVEEEDDEEKETKGRSKSKKSTPKKDSKKTTKSKEVKKPEKSQDKESKKSKKEEKNVEKKIDKKPTAGKSNKKRKLDAPGHEDLKKVKKTPTTVQSTKSRSTSKKGNAPAKKK